MTNLELAAELRRLHAENEAMRAKIGQGVPTDEQIMATVQQKGFGFSQSRPLAQQWDQVCELIRAVVRERNTHPAPQQIGHGDPVGTAISYYTEDGHTKWTFQPTKLGWEMPQDSRANERGARSCFDVYTHPAPQQKPLTDDLI